MKGKSSAPAAGSAAGGTLALFGENVFSPRTRRHYLGAADERALRAAIRRGQSLDRRIADRVAAAMKNWALARGATHFTHWFQPLTGTTAEKHEAFLTPDREGGALTRFSGADLIRGEPDASSFPSGGLRATFEARGYTAWDPSSPAFIKEGRNGATLCIPTVFCGYHGEALDKKTPLLRSLAALERQLNRLAKLFKIRGARRPGATLGAEQEYFLVDKRYYEKRLDLLQTGRTLFGRRPAKHQQMEDHYFGAIKPRVMAFMCDLDRELWRLGVPVRTRHNEVCPGQFEIAPVYEEINLAVDHNMIVMDTLRDVADRHGFACLLHEKPFAGVNGSGKHNNWSVTGPDGCNWLTPGADPHDNAKFLTMICALLLAVDRRADVLRATVASAGNDLRLGANEAPPAIISIFLGDQLTDIILQLEHGAPRRSRGGGTLALGVSALPNLPRDLTDRNRTSPLAFTGDKFEFRAVGANQSCAGPNVALNTIMAEALDEICGRLERALAGGAAFNAALQVILGDIVRRHKRIIFNGDSYAAAWRREAAGRGLANVATTPAALRAFLWPGTVAMFAKYGVLSERELRSRHDIYRAAYEKTVAIETECALTMARTMILPAALRYERELAETVRAARAAGLAPAGGKRLLRTVAAASERLLAHCGRLETAARRGPSGAALAALADVRATADELEGLVPDDLWPLPSYAEMMFRH